MKARSIILLILLNTFLLLLFVNCNKQIKKAPKSVAKYVIKKDSTLVKVEPITEKDTTYIYKGYSKHSLLDKPNGKIALNKMAMDRYGMELDVEVSNHELKIVNDSNEWVEVECINASQIRGWILREYLSLYDLEEKQKANPHRIINNQSKARSNYEYSDDKYKYDSQYQTRKKAAAIRDRRRRERIAVDNQRKLDQLRIELER